MNKYRKIYGTLVLGIVFVVILLLAVFAYSKSIEENYKAENLNSLQEVSRQGALMLHNEIIDTQRLLLGQAYSIRETFAADPQQSVRSLQEIVIRNNLKRFGIALADGRAYTSDGLTFNVAGRWYFNQALHGQNVVSQKLDDYADGDKIVVYAVPITEENSERTAGVLFATYSLDTFRAATEFSFFGGQGYSYVVEENGNVVVDPRNQESLKNIKNIYTSMLMADPARNKTSVDTLWQLINSKQSGALGFYNGGSKYMYCSPIGINNWMLLTVIPGSIIEAKTDMVLHKTYWLGGLLIAIFAIFMLHIMQVHARNQKELINIAYVDNVTGGYSFAKFFKAAPALLQTSAAPAAIISMDLDGFKYFNDMFGYAEGNDLLRYIWRELKHSLAGGEILAHGVGDTFMLLMRFSSREELLERIQRICEKLNSYNTKSGQVYKLSLSLGIYEVDGETDDVVSMADRAYIARQTIKNKGDTAWAFYDGAVRDKLLREKEIESKMEQALADGAFITYYQPKYSTSEQMLAGGEALVRWQRCDGTIVAPDEFIPLFERNGFINRIDRYMFSNVCRQQKLWLEQGLHPVPLSVNMSRMCLYDPHLVEQYVEILAANCLPSEYVEIELTESAIFEQTNVMKGVIQKLHQAGFKVLMDDFGTGYSSMLMLKDIAIDILKLDKSFVDGIGDERSEKIISNIIRLAHSLRIEVTAEGVETAAQFDFLQSVGCDYIQGYYFGEPQTAAAFAALLAQQQAQ